MPTDDSIGISTVAVLGGGLMGSGIAQTCAMAGYDTIVREVSDELCARARKSIERSFDKSIEKGKATTDDKSAALARIRCTTALDDLADADLVIEAVVEDAQVKMELFGELDSLVGERTLFATNTSSLTVTELAASTQRPDRFLGLHFFNPVPAMKLVEIVRGLRTSADSMNRAEAFVRSLGKEPIRAHDSSGFIVNLLLVPYMIDAIRALESGVGSITDIDRGMTLGAGHPMGPFTLLDFVGLDTTYKIAEIMFDEYRETRYAPPPLLKRMVLAGMLGKKSGKGFYDYSTNPPHTERARVVTTEPPKPRGFRGAFRTDDEARAVYAEAAGIGRIVPRAVAVPADVDDAATLVRWARETGTPLVPRGSGSSMASGAIGDGVIVDLSRLNDIGAIDRDRRRVRVGPGALRGDVERAARTVNLRFPPDPSSGAFATIGGMISTNAAGAHTLRFGAMRPWVASVDCIFDDGSRATLSRGVEPPCDVPALERLRAVAGELRGDAAARATTHADVRKDSSGYGVGAFAETGDVVDLVIGSEGTLVLVVGAELVLAEAARATSSLLGAFPTLESAVIGATRAREAGAVACELLDRTFLDVAARGATLHGIPAGTEGVLLAEVEGESDEAAAEAARALADAFRAAGASAVTLALTGAEETDLWELRHAASPILATLGPSLTSMQFIEDSAVPPAALPAYVRGVRDAFARYGIRGVIFGHAGDSHVHVNPLIDVESPAWRETIRALLDDIASLVARLGGTLDGEHGDGRLRTPLLPRVWSGEAMRLFRLVKQAFDPAGIFNPGVKIPLAGESSIGDVKYDPALAPLPPRARAALDAVVRDRAYQRFRLALVDDAAAG